MSAFSRRRMPDRTPARRLPRGTSVAAVAAAALLVAMSLLASPEAWIR